MTSTFNRKRISKKSKNFSKFKKNTNNRFKKRNTKYIKKGGNRVSNRIESC